MNSVLARRKSLLITISFYYAVLVLSLALMTIYTPQWIYYLPFGGLENLAQSYKGDFSSVMDEVVHSTVDVYDVFDDSIRLSSAMVGAIILMLPVRWVYMRIGLGQNYNHAVAASMIILPLIVTGIVVIVQFSIALGFALAGIVAGVRYRTTLKNTSDALFIFVAIGVGLAAGTSTLGIGLVMSIFFSYTILSLPPITARAADSPKSPWRVKSLDNASKKNS
jgi:hypothetical protein